MCISTQIDYGLLIHLQAQARRRTGLNCILVKLQKGKMLIGTGFAPEMHFSPRALHSCKNFLFCWLVILLDKIPTVTVQPILLTMAIGERIIHTS